VSDYKNIKELIKIAKLDEYLVEDLNLKKAKVIFVLESPHKDEVFEKNRELKKKKYPVAGSAGKTMTEVLFPNKGLSFGEIIFKEHQDSRILKYGVINVSNIPLQLSSYNFKDLTNSCEIVRYLENTKKNDFKKIKNKDLDENEINERNKIMKLIGDSFKERLIPNLDNKLIFLCGNYAENAFKSIFSENKISLIDKIENNIIKITHPSAQKTDKNDWRNNNRKLIQKAINDFLGL